MENGMQLVEYTTLAIKRLRFLFLQRFLAILKAIKYAIFYLFLIIMKK
jgi:hypothetical protein